LFRRSPSGDRADLPLKPLLCHDSPAKISVKFVLLKSLRSKI
jgi:hypothetical protein